MYLFEITSMEPLEPHEDMKYSSFASDGGSLLFWEQAHARLARHCPRLDYLEEHKLTRPYTGLCHDEREGCYWACTGKSSDMIYKLSDTFREVDRFRFGGYDPCYGSIRGIAYDRCDDCLILTFRNKVVTVEKYSLCQRREWGCGCGQCYQCCIRCGEFHYYLNRHCEADMLTIAKGGRVVIHACMPAGHRILGMAADCGGGEMTVRLLSVKHNAYYAVLKGVLVHRRAEGDRGGGQACGERAGHRCAHRPCRPACPPPGVEGRRHHRCLADEARCLAPRTAPCVGGYGGRDAHHGHRPHGWGGEWGCGQAPAHRGCWEERGCGQSPGCRDHWGCGQLPAHRDHWWDGGAWIIQSIALEQTALSHILNAEGEKIQKVVAVSDRPADFLDVNRSVAETITKITHLEQVLFSKLDLACGLLREGRTPRGAE